MSFRPLSAVTLEERQSVARLLQPDPVLSFYWATGLEDLERGIDNRLLRACEDGQGVILGAVFGDLTVFSPSGAIADADIAACAGWPGMVEIHAPSDEAMRYQAMARARLIQTRDMLVMGCRLSTDRQPQSSHSILSPEHAELVAAFYRTHYPETVFDPYMLFMPFVGAFEEGHLVACAGTLVQSVALRSALIGHFATAPSARGKGLATGLGRSLLNLLAEQGFSEAYLATTRDNSAAIAVYEKLGFSVVDRRRQLDLRP